MRQVFFVFLVSFKRTDHSFNLDVGYFSRECSFLTDSNKSASVRIHVTQNEMCEVRSLEMQKLISDIVFVSVVRYMNGRTVCLLKKSKFHFIFKCT